MDVLDIVLFHDGRPLWILDYLHDHRFLLLVCKTWKKRLLTCDTFCNILIKQSWWFSTGVVYNYELHYKSTSKRFTSKSYELAFNVYHEIKKRMIKKLYLVASDHVDSVSRFHYNLGHIFSLETKQVTKYWSGFNMGQSRLGSMKATVDCLRRHYFNEIPSDRKFCRTFVRSEEGQQDFIIRNMFEDDVVKYWFYCAFPCADPASLLKRVIQ